MFTILYNGTMGHFTFWIVLSLRFSPKSEVIFRFTIRWDWDQTCDWVIAIHPKLIESPVDCACTHVHGLISSDEQSSLYFFAYSKINKEIRRISDDVSDDVREWLVSLRCGDWLISILNSGLRPNLSRLVWSLWSERKTIVQKVKWRNVGLQEALSCRRAAWRFVKIVSGVEQAILMAPIKIALLNATDDLITAVLFAHCRIDFVQCTTLYMPVVDRFWDITIYWTKIWVFAVFTYLSAVINRQRRFPCHQYCVLYYLYHWCNFHSIDDRRTSLWGLYTRLRSVKRRKNADFGPINRYISETIEDRHILTIED